MKTNIYLWQYLGESLVEWVICRENQNIHFVLNILFFFENRSVNEIIWKNVIEPNSPQ